MSTVVGAAAAAREGDIVGLPTDTVYGVGVTVRDERAMRALYAVKGRPPTKALPVLAADAASLGTVADVTVHPSRLAELWPGAVTLVVRKTPAAPPWIGDERGTVAVRVPAHETALDLLRRTGPMAVTSANLAGETPALTAAAAEEALGALVAVYVAGTAPGGRPSTVVDLTGPEPVVLREGPVRWS